LLVPILRVELGMLRADGPMVLQKSVDTLSKTGLTRWFPTSDTLSASLLQRITPLLTDALGTITTAGRLLVDLLIVLIVAYFYVTDSFFYDQSALRWFPNAKQEQIKLLWDRSRTRLARWVWAQTAIALLFAVVMSSGLFVLGVPYALTVGTVGGILQIVPFLGSAIALLLALISALSISSGLAFWVLVFYLVVIVIETHIVAPVVYGRSLGLRSVFVLLALVVGAKIQGVIGIIFAVPVSIVISTIFQEIHRPSTYETDQPRANTPPHSDLDASRFADNQAS